MLPCSGSGTTCQRPVTCVASDAFKTISSVGGGGGLPVPAACVIVAVDRPDVMMCPVLSDAVGLGSTVNAVLLPTRAPTCSHGTSLTGSTRQPSSTNVHVEPLPPPAGCVATGPSSWMSQLKRATAPSCCTARESLGSAGFSVVCAAFASGKSLERV